MQLLVLILNKVDYLQLIMTALLNIGIGTTVLDCEGAMHILNSSNVEPPPIFGSLRCFLNPEYKASKLLLMVVPSEKLEIAKNTIKSITGILERPDTGIMFNLPLSGVEGMKNS